MRVLRPLSAALRGRRRATAAALAEDCRGGRCGISEGTAGFQIRPDDFFSVQGLDHAGSGAGRRDSLPVGEALSPGYRRAHHRRDVLAHVARGSPHTHRGGCPGYRGGHLRGRQRPAGTAPCATVGDAVHRGSGRGGCRDGGVGSSRFWSLASCSVPSAIGLLPAFTQVAAAAAVRGQGDGDSDPAPPGSAGTCLLTETATRTSRSGRPDVHKMWKGADDDRDTHHRPRHNRKDSIPSFRLACRT